MKLDPNLYISRICLACVLGPNFMALFTMEFCAYILPRPIEIHAFIGRCKQQNSVVSSAMKLGPAYYQCSTFSLSISCDFDRLGELMTWSRFQHDFELQERTCVVDNI